MKPPLFLVQRVRETQVLVQWELPPPVEGVWQGLVMERLEAGENMMVVEVLARVPSPPPGVVRSPAQAL
ncbi:MAG: hypothetical protein KAS16_08175, partial [Thermoplasmata archaeon]|nr:hypothetical protein [Thermoplasmata archaeon]